MNTENGRLPQDIYCYAAMEQEDSFFELFLERKKRRCIRSTIRKETDIFRKNGENTGRCST